MNTLLLPGKVILQSGLSWLAAREAAQKDPETTERYVKLLGAIRAPEAVQSLMTLITFKSTASAEKQERTPVLKTFVVAAALIEIGKPASLAALEELGRTPPEKDDLKRDLLLLVILRVEGEDVARFMITKAAKERTDENERNNLSAALQQVEKVKGWQ
jgi:hypothetical protein